MKTEQEAWVDWADSDEGKRCCCIDSLKAPSNQRDFLVNRLWRAFNAGRAVGEKITKDRIAAMFQKQIEEAVRSEP